MFQQLTEIFISGIFAFFAGFVIWPPRDTAWAEWRYIFERGITLMVVVALLSIAFGYLFENVTNTRLSNFIVGGIGAYLIGMVGIEIGMDTTTPVHLIMYGGMVVCLTGGVALSQFL